MCYRNELVFMQFLVFVCMTFITLLKNEKKNFIPSNWYDLKKNKLAVHVWLEPSFTSQSIVEPVPVCVSIFCKNLEILSIFIMYSQQEYDKYYVEFRTCLGLLIIIDNLTLSTEILVWGIFFAVIHFLYKGKLQIYKNQN